MYRDPRLQGGGTAPPAVRFGDFSLDPATQQLVRNGESVRIDPKAWDMLTFLVDRAGQMIAKHTLLAGVWPDVIVSDAALSQTMMRLRAALGDDARNPRYIETVHRRGFRFIAPVTEGAVDRAPAASEKGAAFVGRVAELAQLHATFAGAQRGERALVMIDGDAGIGKTTLAEAFLATVPAAWRVVRVQCIEQHGSAEPYMPVLDAVDRLAQSEGGAAVVAVLRRHAPTWLAQMPWLVDEREAAMLRDGLSDGTRARMLREMGGALDALAGDAGLVLLVEDLHWSDPASLDLLTFLAQRTVAARLVVVATFRLSQAIAFNHPLAGLVRSLRARSQCASITLEPLPFEAVAAFLAQRFPGRAVPETLAEQLFAQTEGNPLFLQMMVDHLVEEGVLVREDDGWALHQTAAASDSAKMPDSLRQMIELVLDDLEPSDLSLLEAASIVGDTFAAAAVAAALGDGAEVGTIEAACDQVVRKWQLLNHAEGQTWPDGTQTARYEFRHALYRQVLYDRIPPGTRRRLHQNVGERLEQAYQTHSGRVAAELAVHFDKSSDDARAVRYFLKAAHRARRRFADREAEVHCLSALRRIEHLPESGERDVQEVRARVYLGLVRAVLKPGEADEAEGNSARALALADGMVDHPLFFPLFHGVWRIVHEVNGPVRAAPLARRLLRLADANGSADQRIEAGHASGLVDLIRGSIGSAVGHFLRAVEVYDERAAAPAAPRELYGPTRWKEIGAQVLGFSGLALTLQGLTDQGYVYGKRALDLCRAGGLHPFTEVGLLFVAATSECLLGEVTNARSLNARGLALSQEHQVSQLGAMCSIQSGWITMQAGDRTGGMALLREQTQLFRQYRYSSSYPLAALYFADGCRMVGADREGFDLLQLIRSECGRRGIHWFDAELTRLEVELLMLRGEPIAALESRLRAAVSLARKQGAGVFALRAAMSLVRMGPTDPRARRLLASVYASFSEGRGTPLLTEAAALLRSRAAQQKS